MDGAFPSGVKTEPYDGGYAGSSGGRGGRGRGFRGTELNAKTKLCTRWMQGDCRFGDRCNFAHGEHELRRMDGEGGRGFPSGRGRGGFGGRQGPGRGRGGFGGGGYGGQPGYGGAYGGMEQGFAGGGEAVPDDLWAAQGYPVAGPQGWTMYKTKDTGESYYHNSRTNTTVWDRPPEWPVGM